ncbi:NAD(P)-binding protein [Aureobasidium pullulans]|uniref:NAD(P)-binding protein n=1 Tax=Aureobasidium pullulans TaxID=5580 RepID=A0AB74JN38_AURPU|nr:NAD(P)-binding protein [Aureobasidium pullulans]
MWSPPQSYQARPIAVLGGGVLGPCCWAAAGYNVNIREPSLDQQIDANHWIEANISTFTSSLNNIPGQVNFYTELASAVDNAWIVFEAIPEVLELKLSIFAELETQAPSDCILTSNSSSFKSSEMLSSLVDEDTKTRICNVHYIMPPQIKVVEIMTCGFTAPAILDFLVQKCKETALQPFLVQKESMGFIYNRLWAAVKRETLMILSEGVSDAGVVDEIFKSVLGTRYGPCFMMDHVGLDTVANIERHYVRERGLSDEHTVKFLEDNFIEQGKLGFKSEKGGLLSPRSL